MHNTEKYPFAVKLSKTTGVSIENLIAAFEIERDFHEKVLNEIDIDKRRTLCADVYNAVHPLYGENADKHNEIQNIKRYTIKIFSRELENKSILDVGCGKGDFLLNISKNLKYKKLTGIDVSVPHLPENKIDIHFINSDILNFDLNEKFDIVFSDNVLEHIPPQDILKHLQCIKEHVKDNGKFILIVPNRLFGPSDVSRILDYSYTNKIGALGTHLNEVTYLEIIDKLKEAGFNSFESLFQGFFAVRKLKLPRLKIPIIIFEYMEKNKTLLNLLYKLKFNGKPLFKFDVMLICGIK